MVRTMSPTTTSPPTSSPTTTQTSTGSSNISTSVTNNDAAQSFPDEVWEHVFSFLDSDSDRNSASAVCRAWHRIDRFSRERICVGNCYSVEPTRAARRFPRLRRAWIKGKPHFADFDLVPYDWGGSAHSWLSALASHCPLLQDLRLKRMLVTDDCLELLASSFPYFRSLVLVSCEGFTTAGLAALAAGCRNLEELNLQENEVEDRSSHWFGCFPETCNSLVSLSLACLEGDMNATIIERLVSRCPKLKTLRLNHTIPLEKLVGILHKAPNLVDLGIGRVSADPHPDLYNKLHSAFKGIKTLRSLSGFSEACPDYLPAVYPICEGLTSLNLSYATIQSADLLMLVVRCRNLRKLWVLDFIEDDGLEAVATSCKFLQELRVFPSDPYNAGAAVPLTERGLVAISAGCTMLNSVLYFCRQMTNSALITVARNRPNLVRFRLCILEPRTPDYITLHPLDAGFGAIVENCRGLRRLSVSGLLTDRVFQAIGAKAHKLEMLSIAFAGDGDAGLHHILSGCKSLRKLEIRDCPFGGKPLLTNAAKLETMRSLWMSSCSVTLGACKLLAKKIPGLNVEVIDEGKLEPRESWPDDCPVEKLYIYRTMAGRRPDMPHYVWKV